MKGKVKSISPIDIEIIPINISELLNLNIYEFYSSEQRFIEIVEKIKNNESLDKSQKICFLIYLYFEADVNNLNICGARDIIIEILETYGIEFEDKYFFSNGYSILKIRNYNEKINYLNIGFTLPERWNYWFYRWNEYNKELLYQNIINILAEIKDSLASFEYKTYRDLVYIDIELLTKEIEKIINFTNLLKDNKKNRLKSSVKSLNSAKNDIKGKKGVLWRIIYYLEEFFKKEFPLEQIIDLLYAELDKRATAGLRKLDFLSDLIYLKLKNKNVDVPTSLFKFISNRDFELNNIDNIKKFLKGKLTEWSNPNLEEYNIFYAIRNINIISKIPPFQEIHFFDRKIDDTYNKELGGEFTEEKKWVRITVKACGTRHALFLSENILRKYRSFGILKNLHFKENRKNYIIYKNNQRINTSHSIEERRLYRIKKLDHTKGVDLRDFLITLENTLEKMEFSRLNTLTELLVKIENTFDITDQFTFLWIIIEALKDNKSYKKDFAKIFTIIDEIQIIQGFYMTFFPIIQNNWDNFKENYLSLTKLENFPKDFLPNEFIDSLELLYDALENNYMKQKMKAFSEKTPISHFQRIKKKNKLNLKLILTIYGYRNQYFHSGFYDIIELRKIIPILYQKLMIIIESYISYLTTNRNKSFRDYITKWVNIYDTLLVQLENNKKYSKCFSDLLG